MIWNITTPYPHGTDASEESLRRCMRSHLELDGLSLVLAYAATSTLPALAANLLFIAASTLNALPIVLTMSYRGLRTLQVRRNKAGTGAGQDA